MTQPNLEVVGVRAVVEGFDAYIRNIGQVQRSTDKAASGIAQSGKKASTASAQFRGFAKSAGSVASGLLGVQVGLATVRAAFGSTIGAAIAFESSFAGVRKTVDATEEEFAALEAGFRGLAREIPISVFELNALGEAAGQLGIKTENIIDFTETMAQLGATTNLSAEEAATALARLANITQLPQDKFDELGSTIVELGNNFATTEREIVEMGLRLAGAGAQIGLTQDQILAFATALSSMGIRAEAGGTALSRVFVEIEKAVRSGGEDLVA
ncbi:MAG: phage tail tape measure protein, partial [Gemmatimonadales bacterium]